MEQRSNRNLFLFSAAAALVLLLVVCTAVVLPNVLNLKPIREEIVRGIEKKLHCRVSFSSLDFRFVPWPRMIIHDGKLSCPGRLDGSFNTAKIFPRLISLLFGKIEIQRLHILSPDFRLRLTDLPVPASPTLGEAHERFKPELVLSSISSIIPSEMPNMAVRITDGSLALFSDGRPPIRIQGFQCSLSMEGSSLNLEGQAWSNVSDYLSTHLRLDTARFKGEGRVVLTGFRPDVLLNTWFPGTSPGWGQSEVHLTLDFQADSPRNLAAQFQGFFPYLTLEQGEEQVVLSAEFFSGHFSRQETVFDLTLDQLKLGYPHMDLFGSLHMNMAHPLICLELEGTQTDAAAVRKVATIVWPNEQVVTKIFEIIRGGTVPNIQFAAQGATFGDLKKSENFRIDGRMEQGRVYIPEVELDIWNVYGDVVISNGILEGTGLSGKVGESVGWDGGLIVGLVRKQGAELPFFLDITIEAILSDLPSILHRVVKNDLFLQELARIKNPRGRALGRLVLGDTLKSVQTKVVVENFELSGEYQRFPYPIKTRGGAFTYEGGTAAVFGLEAVLGHSRIEEASIVFNSRPTPHLDIQSVRGRLVMEEVFPWLQSFEAIRKGTREVDSVRGTLLVETGNWQGVLRAGNDWRYRFQGSAESLLVKSDKLPDSLVLKKGRFEVHPDRVVLNQWDMACSDALFRASGRIGGSRGKAPQLDLTLDGSLGEITIRWLHDALQVPFPFRLHPPIRFSQLRWIQETSDSHSLSGTLAFIGAEAQLDLVLEAKSFTVRRCSIRDRESSATFAFKHEKDHSSFSFDGHLTGNTLRGLLEQNTPLEGEVQGNFQADIHWSEPGKSTASGTLHVRGIEASWPAGSPLIIHSAALEGSGHGIDLRSSTFNWQGREVSMNGSVGFHSDAFDLNLDASTDEVYWQVPKEAKESYPSASGAESGRTRSSIPLKGVIRMNSSSLTCEGFTWRPFRAELRILPDGFFISLTDSVLCGIPTPGNIRFGAGGPHIDLKLSANGVELERSLVCLWNNERLITGSFSLRGEIRGQGVGQALMESLQGGLSFTARDGRIYRLRILSKILALLNLTEVFRGRLPDLFEGGFAYDSIHAKVHFDKGKLFLDESVIDGASMKIVCRGELDLVQKRVDLSGLVAPFKTADNILQYMPLLNYIFEGGLMTIPFHVNGDVSDPDVHPMAASKVGSELLNLMKRTLQAPLKVIEPLLPQDKKDAGPS
ncbi:MAG: AsmA-like C-terminal region-containing protein [Syntrophobacteraceae bacterium]|nr:AsmA-like C-terminal region-containing protein [Syntrophobacteraceae bacterium]